MPVRTSVYLLSGYSPSCQEDGWLEIRGDRFGGEDRLTLVMTWWTGAGPPAGQLSQGAAFQGSTEPARAAAAGLALGQVGNLPWF